MPPSRSKPRNGGETHIRDRVRDRADACPGALRLHRADDGGLARLRLPTGVLTPRQADALADAADRLGDGRIGITSRGNIDLRGLPDDCGSTLADLLGEAGLLPSAAHERVRNVVVSPLCGLDGRALGDALAWARELDALLCAHTWTTGLSGRFLFAVDDGRGDVVGLGGDVTLLAESGGRALVRIGGLAWRVAAQDAPPAALAAAEAFLTVARESGTGAWRVADLPGGRFVEAAVTERLAGAGVAASPARADAPPVAAPPEPGLVGDRAVSVAAPLGRVSSGQLRALAAEPAGEVRVTPWRGFVVAGLPGRAAAEERLAALHDAGYLTRPGSPWLAVTACTGRPGCGKALADVRADARPLDDAALRGLPAHWSGCDRRCGHPQGDWVDVLATGDGAYGITVRTARRDNDDAQAQR
ncbi:precorrin-3B synthase [Streptomyces sp. MRC013]|uniref:precorrin-3B synthase n=1 Tax=Streptomyces sp. MRC013 TaxID=2898276 RepID=UPI00202703A2|nr:precorrin-3B synthase [Streptomyces sp. MRC013]URM90573.1 precorrin-3B synthase [Streptomyces sp. MRC013]